MTQAEAFLKERGLDHREMRLDYTRQVMLGRSNVDFFMREHEVRTEYIQRFGFAVLDTAAIEVIRPYSPILEVGSGSGYWAMELSQAGIDIIATDPGSTKYCHGDDNRSARWTTTYTEVEAISGVDAVKKYPNRNLLTVWPDLGRWPARVLLEFTKSSQGQFVIYVGEGSGGCTADDRFHSLLDKFYDEEADYMLPKFSGLHDNLRVYKRRKREPWQWPVCQTCINPATCECPCTVCQWTRKSLGSKA